MQAELENKSFIRAEPEGRVVADGQGRYVNTSPAAAAQTALSETLNQSPRVRALGALQHTFNQHPAVVAQAKLAQTLSSRPVIQRVLHGSYDQASYGGANDHRLNPISAFLTRVGMPPTPSQNIRLGLRLAGVPDSNQNLEATPNQAHHIVERNDANAQPARALLALAGIDIDSAVNGVFLPESHADDTGDATVHVGSHVHGYANVVNGEFSVESSAIPLAPS